MVDYDAVIVIISVDSGGRRDDHGLDTRRSWLDSFASQTHAAQLQHTGESRADLCRDECVSSMGGKALRQGAVAEEFGREDHVSTVREPPSSGRRGVMRSSFLHASSGTDSTSLAPRTSEGKLGV